MRPIASICLTIGLLFFCLIPAANAENYYVDRFDDTANATNCSLYLPNDCSLRGAIIKANQDSAHDDIYLSAGTYTITIAGTWEDAALTGDLDITEGLTIQGGTAGVTIDGASLDRVFHVMGGTTYFYDLTITGGNSPSIGGGILSNSLLFLNDCTITDNSSNGLGGGIYNSAGSLYLDRTTVSSNTASTSAGGIYNQTGLNLNIEDSTIYSNFASNGAGGGIFNNGSSTIRRSSIWGNNTYYASGSHFRGGGGIFNNGFLNLFNCSLTINWAHDDPGGAIYNNNNLDLTHVSIGANLSSPATSTIIFNAASGNLTMVNSLMIGKCTNDSGSVTSIGGNLEQAGNTCLLTGPGDQVNVADAMTTLIDVGGGSKKCVALETGSPAIDLGYGTYCSDKDQRGFDRPVDGDDNGSINCDIGAFEILADLPIFSDGFESGNTWRWDFPSP